MLLHTDAILILLVALAIDAVVGDPDAVWRRVPHPVAWMGALIARLDTAWNRPEAKAAKRKAAGVAALAVILCVAIAAGAVAEAMLRALPWHTWTIGVVAAVLLAQNSLYVHVARVAEAFATGGIAEARRAVAMIVGRDPESLDEAGICRAAIETAAENFSDGVVAPAFWFAVLGLPGLAAYKAVNTADSMIGHLSERHRDFGWAAARCDDLLNLVPARLAGLLVTAAAPLAAGSPAKALRVMIRDARLHRSPNAGWPEAAMAGALGLALAGPRRYGARLVDDPFLHAEGRREATPGDIRRALRVMISACLGLAAIVAAGALLVS
ncbi:adenosylcobinamide-phosphate synthase CbiB [Phreatobacter sp.]|uniref:adenosylcobinamide-phosphate synthase CbiB n=1 Tax=Phreatobacter sp. TaxID=1966341 RepID=UPI0022C8B898|nr:adenosylcobinamide-phosphate synthase CbiB [Phreatobacter sp.]MCZ8316720.1 adenosylcobinamide-phosphate synthase CbiB [Phreatobacter sp.]